MVVGSFRQTGRQAGTRKERNRRETRADCTQSIELIVSESVCLAAEGEGERVYAKIY